MNKKIMFIVIGLTVVFLLIGIFLFNKAELYTKEEKGEISLIGNFNVDLIKLVHEKKNYLISPYSIEIALNMLRDGSSGKTKDELGKVLSREKMNNLEISDNLKIANALFIKSKYQDFILESYRNKLKRNYDADILIDELETPEVINRWVKEKTNNMIPKILDSISPDFVLGLANAISLDIKWQSEFDTNNTNWETFTKIDGTKKDVQMMHNSYRLEDYQYIKDDDYEGIILPYAKMGDGVELEFIALLPNDIDDFINNLNTNFLTNSFLNSQKASNNLKINLSLPKFTYEYEIPAFIDVLKKLGINEAFTPLASFDNLVKDNPNLKIYVDEAIHKTKIELNEVGTKAAAVTYFGMKNTAFYEDTQEINIIFNRPFIYMIRDKITKEIIFFGSLYEPK